MSARLLTPLLVLLAALPLGQTATAQPAEPERVRVHGSHVLGARLVPQLAEAWLVEAGYSGSKQRRVPGGLEIFASREDGDVVVEIISSGTAAAFAKLARNEAELGMAARAPTAKELDDAWLAGRLRSPDLEFVVALQGLSILVHPDNPVTALSRSQLRDVFSGRVRDWSGLGGRPGPIRLHGRPAASGLTQMLDQLVLAGEPLAPALVTHASTAAVAQAVARDPQAMAFAPLLAPAPGARALAVSDGGVAIAPTRLAAMTEDYPLVRRLNLHGSQQMSALGRSLALFSTSPAGQSIVRQAGYLSVTPAVDAAVPDPAIPGDYAQMLAGAGRLQTTLRFGNEYTLLDSRGVQDLQRIVDFMAEPANRDRELMLMAFTQPESRDPARALFHSHDRVDFVAELLQDAGINVSRRRGFGGAQPLAGGKSEQDQFRNERVEIWVR
ncbi:MAG: substrate-binding domain-containing protein [Arenimonas sp.]|nr:substrate-binding domain-containing protein [Arenimonas sp.]